MADSTSDLINYTKEQALNMFDALSRVNGVRRKKPLDQFDYIEYDHRYYYDTFNLLIGDVWVMIPPEFIYVSSESFSQNIQTLRQENSQKQKTGYHKRTVHIDIVFNGMDEINGYKVPSPVHKDGDEDVHYYYVDGLRALLAQFKLTPFLPIANDLLNNAYKIYVVALQSIVIETIDGFQNALMAKLTLQEVDMMPYIEMPNIMFQHTIDWDLFRFYTQSILTKNHVYKNLQELPINRDHTAFKLSILNEEAIQTVEVEESTLQNQKPSQTVKDTYTKTKEATILERVIDPENYRCLIDSNEHDVYISAFQCSYANMLTSIQMSDASTPTLQYIGGLDTQFGITFETTDVNVVGAIEQCQILNDLMVRNNPKVRGSIGFVKIETDLVAFCGSLFCTIESVETHTVPGLPGLYQVRLLCVSYDIAQSKREELNGFMPFDGYESSIEDLSLGGDTFAQEVADWADAWLQPYFDFANDIKGTDRYEMDLFRMMSGNPLHAKIRKNINQCIEQSYEGLMKKIYQDNYAEWKLRQTMEIYPDLRLPTYDEVDQALANINAFRKANGQTQLPYSKYPVQPNNIGYGMGETRTTFPNHWADNGGNSVYKDGQCPISEREYNVFVDPDFYVFYPNSYLSVYKDEEAQAKEEEQSTGSSDIMNTYSEPKQSKPISGQTSKIIKSSYHDGEDTDSDVTKFITNLKNEIGKHYCANAEGEVQDYLGNMYDDLGLLTYVLKEMGILPANFKRLTFGSFGSLDIFKQVSDIRIGDVILNSTRNDMAVCTGLDGTNNISVIKVTEQNGVIEEQLFYTPGSIYRILPLQRDSKMQGTHQSNPYDIESDQYPDENGQIIPKQPKALDTTVGYTSANPYGDDSNRAYSSASLSYGTAGNAATNNLVNQDLGVWSPISEKELNDFINTNAPKNSPFRGKASVFIRAGKESGLDPRYILSHAALESGWGTTRIAKDKNNYFGIGAFDSSPYASAKSFGTGLEKGIIGGAKWIATNYYNSKYGQKTLNQMRNNNGVHQYATDPEWHNKIANIMSRIPANSSAQFLNNSAFANPTSTVSFDNSGEIRRKERERRNRADIANQLEEITKPIQLTQASVSNLTLPEVQDDGSAWSDGAVTITEYRDMTFDEFNSLALTVAAECEGENLACKMAMAQHLYDIAQVKYKGNGLTLITQGDTFKNDRTHLEQKDIDEAKSCVQKVFQAGMRWKKDYTVLGFTSFGNSNYANQFRTSKYGKIGSVNQHNFFGMKTPSMGIGYNIAGYGVSKSSSNDIEEVYEYSVDTVTVQENGFGKPIYIKSATFDTHSPLIGKVWQVLNSDERRIYTAFVDDCQYSAKGRMVKAFPAFLLCILDDQAQWYDGRKLWTNYYVYKPVVNISYHAANDMPTATAQITVTNTFHNLDRSSAALVNYSISEDKDYSSFNRWLYKNFGMIAGGLKITDRLIQLHSILFTHTKLREGARIHLRMGYGSDPMSLAPVINGTVSAITLGDQINITVTSDGHELIQSITSDKTKDVNNGILGLFGLGATQEASDIIGRIMTKRQSWVNHLFFGKNWYEGSKYNIEHFGLYINSGDKEMYSGLAGGIDAGKYEQYDLMMNIYNASTEQGWVFCYRHWNYMYDSENPVLPGRDGEANIVFNQYNMTPWDVFQLCAQTMPEFLIKPEKYQFDSRLYYGLPFDLTKYRYDVINGTIYQECKANTQMHYIDSLSTIIENQVSVTSRPSFTNAKVIYTRGSTPKSTSVIHSDDTIDNSKQSTHIIDSCIVQDYLGIDALHEFLGISRQGKVAARKLGISNLLYGWQQQYQGQLLCLGCPHINPDDYLMVNDFYTSLNGLAVVREVIHSFNTNTGFTTSIVPGIIGFCPEQDSGNIVLISNFLKLYSDFSDIAQNRKILKENSERYADIIATLDKSLKNVKDAQMTIQGWKVASGIGNAAAIASTGYTVYSVIRGIKNAGSILKALKAVGNTYKAISATQKALKFGGMARKLWTLIRSVDTVGKGIETVNGAIMAAGAATAPATCGISLAISIIISIIIDVLFSAIEDWLQNRNTVVLLPLWWEGEPFVSGVKDGEKILLIPSSSTGTEENTKEDGIETDEDEITVEDN